jgi:hypothetical protein
MNSSRRIQSWWFVLAVAIIATIPMWAMRTPVLGDLPAHVSRYHVQALIDTSPYLSSYFVYEWRWLPNLGVDVLVAALAPVIGVERSAHLLVALIPALTAAGMLLMGREAHGRLPWTAVFSLPLIFSYPFIFGFVNFCLAVGMAFLGFFVSLRLTHAGRPALRTFALVLLAPVVFVSHMAGYGVFAILCFGGLLGDALESNERFLRAFWRAGIASAPVAWPLIFLLLWADAGAGPTGKWFDFRTLATWGVGMLRMRWMAADIALAALIVGVALLPLLLRGKFGWSLTLLIPGVLLAVCCLVLPGMIGGSDYASARLIPVACAVLVLAVRPRHDEWRPGVMIGLAIFFAQTAVLTVTIAEAVTAADRDLAGLGVVRPGSRIAALQITRCERYWEPRYLNHIQAMATVRRDAMVNDHFALAHGQVVSLSRAEAARPMPPPTDVREPNCDRSGTLAFDVAYKKVDLDQVDYLWIIDRVGVRWPDDARLHRVWSQGRSAIFAVRHGD